MQPLDIFVSYAWRDNQPPAGPGVDSSTDRWVWIFHKALTASLGMKLGRDVEVWIDRREIKTNEKIQAVLSAELARSQLLLALMSPSWLSSEWCPRELQEFLRTHPGTPTAESVYVVEIEPVDRAEWKQRIDVKGMEFHKSIPGGFGRVRLGNPLPTFEDKDYYAQIASLSNEICSYMKALQIAPGPVGGGSGGSEAKTPEASGPAVATSLLLWVADPGPDLRDDQRDLIAAVHQAGFNAVTPNLEDIALLPPAQQLPQMKHGLASASLLVQMVGPEPGPIAPDGRSWAALQAGEARAVAQAREVPYLLWRRPRTLSRTIADEDHLSLLTGAVEQGLEEFRYDVIKRLRAMNARAPGPATESGLHETKVCLSFTDEDIEVAETVATMLSKLNVDYIGFPSPSQFSDAGKADRLCADEDAALKASAGVIIIYGKAATEWLTTKIMSISQLRGRGRGRWGALIDAAAPGKGMPPLVPTVQRQDWRDRPRPDLLKQFIDSLRGPAHV